MNPLIQPKKTTPLIVIQALSFGLIVEEVEKVYPALVYRNDKGQVKAFATR